MVVYMKCAWNELVRIVKEGDYTPREAVMAAICIVLSGVLLGMFLSPKKHVVLGSNNGNNNTGTFDGLTYDDDEDDDE